VSYGLTQDLLRFWKKCGFVPTYLRQTANDLTGEHSNIVLRLVHHRDDEEAAAEKHGEWLADFSADFRRRFVNLLGFDFRKFSPGAFLTATRVSCSSSFLGRERIYWNQGCQMVYFQTKNPNLGKFWRIL
jgi:tRNA(Met) C34 N-acetyltransferase TmcA